jgi:hypothetical protein
VPLFQAIKAYGGGHAELNGGAAPARQRLCYGAPAGQSGRYYHGSLHHTFRGTGMTAYLELYDRREDRVMLDEVAKG